MQILGHMELLHGVYWQGRVKSEAEVSPSLDGSVYWQGRVKSEAEVSPSLEDEWKDTLGPNPQQFLLYDNGPEAVSRIIAFATLEGLLRLAAAETIYILYGRQLQDGSSTVYSSNKTRAVYSELFDVVVDSITQFGINLHVQRVLTDFEDAVLRAISASFATEVNSCRIPRASGCVLYPPMYPPAIWNVHEATLHGNSRTNNICEAWNK
ncbi:hypothetical protein E2C01_014581 [Portunus trituberculatus]|uniref:Uncharacterized protein n=1 Tax=Portunus trituberculatus TaxID=210409 RepID=A0A5B7DKE5_PORTR|nr:hypothetical protein [Portunus trituberculatus]